MFIQIYCPLLCALYLGGVVVSRVLFCFKRLQARFCGFADALSENVTATTQYIFAQNPFCRLQVGRYVLGPYHTRFTTSRLRVQ